MATDANETGNEAARYEFKAEIRQVLDILAHSLYTEREIFLRELISNASDALNRFKFESLTATNLHDAGAELGIWISADKDAKTLTIRDSGLGMTQEEMIENLGTIAQSGAKSFLSALEGAGAKEVSADVIGQFGVGFYSAFMVAEELRVTSRSFRPDAEAAFWSSGGQGSYTVGTAEKTERGTTIELRLKEDAHEFLEPYRLRQIIKTHSDFIAFPVYLEDGEFKQVNQQTALWRKAAKEVDEAQYEAFYGQLTLDSDKPLKSLHISADVPIQFYALLFIPSSRDYRVFREDYGLKLYARKVLIEERSKDLLPPYLRFLEGVVDSEDIPLNVSREAVQATPVIGKIRNALTGRVLAELKRMAEKDTDVYRRFYQSFGQAIKEGVATDHSNRDKLIELLRFPSSKGENEDELVSLADYAARMPEGQKEIYYLLGDDYRVALRSAHLEPFRKRGLEVLLFTDPVDAFMLMGLSRYADKPFKAIDETGLELPPEEAAEPQQLERATDLQGLLSHAREVLGERVEDVRESTLLTGSPCRLVNPSGTNSGMQRMQRLMGQEGDVPKKILELNPQSELIKNLTIRLERDPQDALVGALLEQLYENELLMEGLHPNPAEMIPRLQRLMAEAAKSS